MIFDNITITILEDGTIRTETSKVSAQNHSSADAFLKNIQSLAGGAVKTERRQPHTHVHEHAKEVVRG